MKESMMFRLCIQSDTCLVQLGVRVKRANEGLYPFQDKEYMYGTKILRDYSYFRTGYRGEGYPGTVASIRMARRKILRDWG